MTRLENDLLELLAASVCGSLGSLELKWSPLTSVCVVMASGGYPGSYPKGKVITGLDAANALTHTKVFHAGTALKDGQIVTNGGRVLGVTALGKDLKAAQTTPLWRKFILTARISAATSRRRRCDARRNPGRPVSGKNSPLTLYFPTLLKHFEST